MSLGSGSCSLYAWEGVTLERHARCTAAVAERLYGPAWRYSLSTMKLPDSAASTLLDALTLSALLHDAGKALFDNPRSFRCHEVYGAILLTSAARASLRAHDPRRALAYGLAALTAYLHHHGMGSSRYAACLAGTGYQDILRRFLTGKEPRCQLLVECLKSATENESITGMLDKLCSYASRGTRLLTSGSLAEQASTIAIRALRQLGVKHDADAIIGRLSTLLVGFVSIADSVSALLEKREENQPAINCTSPRRYHIRILCEITGFKGDTLTRLIAELATTCSGNTITPSKTHANTCSRS
ncbi:hypothetical protein Pyrfu_0434 [Pyrolobus fumarii 1A]|uniref:Uncharacterized protein n=1 Tax=Pyrolobus fumarii (strain DSM 11204 / 1A) TaxID=694429 RepID=G0EG57_PYRF1|nr:HD domain-containing protein [Pyrolobus fumarii]AEM38305.1 hypothetical protein Pyrfu_0434 [Pyrolobus fumarii 1A]